MRIKAAIISGVVICAACESGATSEIAQASQALVYGEVDRVDVAAVDDPVVSRVAAATALLVLPEHIECNATECTISTIDVTGGEWPLCPDTPLYGRVSSESACSGVLVGPDLLLTTANCGAACEDLSVVFGFEGDEDGASPTTVFPSDAVYSCTEQIASFVHPGDDGWFAEGGWSLLRMDRVAAGHAPVGIRRGYTPAVSDDVFAVGHILGTPKQALLDGEVEGLQADYFEVDLDLFGAWGASVAHRSSGSVVGISWLEFDDDLVEFVEPGGSYCSAEVVCSDEDGCAGERKWRRVDYIDGPGSGPYPADFIPLRPVEIMAAL